MPLQFQRRFPAPSFALLLLTGLFLSFASNTLYALPFATGRAGGGYTFLGGDKGGKSSSTASLSGLGRFGYALDDNAYIFAIDVSAYRILKNKSLGANQDGNGALLVFGYDFNAFTMWVAAGAGEIRSRDRAENKDLPYRYYTNNQALGMQWKLYSADYARVELGASLTRITPDADWRAKTKLNSINSLQIDIGFKLFNW